MTDENSDSSLSTLVLILLVGAAISLATSFCDVLTITEVAGWSSADCIVEARVPGEYFEVQYLYEVEGELFRGFRPELVYTDLGSEYGSQVAGQKLFPVGGRLKAHIDPEGERSYVREGQAKSATRTLAFSLLALMLGLGWSSWRGHLKFSFALFCVFFIPVFLYTRMNQDEWGRDEIVPPSLDPRPYLKVVRLTKPHPAAWDKLQEGMTLEEALTFTATPLGVYLDSETRLCLEFYKQKSYVFERPTPDQEFRLKLSPVRAKRSRARS